jgi:hypothetical protein
MTKKKKKITPLYKRIRKIWTINPRERIREDKELVEDNPCENCGNVDPGVCYGCQFG